MTMSFSPPYALGWGCAWEPMSVISNIRLRQHGTPFRVLARANGRVSFGGKRFDVLPVGTMTDARPQEAPGGQGGLSIRSSRAACVRMFARIQGSPVQ